MLWQPKAAVFLPNSLEEWKENIKYMKAMIREVLETYNLLQYTKEDVQLFDGFTVDFFLEKFNLAIKIDDIVTRNSGKAFFGLTKIEDNTPYLEWKKTNELGIRVLHAYETEIFNENKWNVFKNMITYSCNLSKKIYARNTKVVIKKAIDMKPMFLENNIQGYRTAKTAFVLVDKHTEEPLMCYTVGHSFFGKGAYDAEIARGCCITNYHNSGVGIQVIGGASKIWKAILTHYSEQKLDGTPGQINSIVYYTDSRYYDGRSIKHLMDSPTLPGKVETLKETPSFTNFWVDLGVTKNREPNRHSFIMQQMREGKILVIPNPGTVTYCYTR